MKLEKKNGGMVTFGNNGKGKVAGIGKIGQPNSTIINDVLLVEGLKHNLLSVSQFCDNECKVMFESYKCTVIDKSGKTIVNGQRHGNVYIVDLFELKAKCLVVTNSDPTLWHRRLGHMSMQLIERMFNKNLVEGLPKLKFDKE